MLFRHCETVIEKFLKSSRGSSNFLIFCLKMDVKNPKKRTNSVQLLGFSGTVEENTWHLEVLLLFLSLIYGADLGRSRLVFCHLCLFLQFCSFLFLYNHSKLLRFPWMALVFSRRFLLQQVPDSYTGKLLSVRPQTSHWMFGLLFTDFRPKF